MTALSKLVIKLYPTSNLFGNMTFSPTYSFLTLSLLISTWTEAAVDHLFPHLGRTSLMGAVTSDVKAIGGDGLLPVYGNERGFIFTDFMAKYGNDEDAYFLSPGVGLRQIINNQLVGAYFFVDNDRTSSPTHFWVLNPGLEWMTPHWDAHLNGYHSLNKSKQIGPDQFASFYGDNSSVTFVRDTHNQYDRLIAPFAIIGNGVDAEVGYSFSELNPLRSRVYAGIYYYSPPKENEVYPIKGFIAGVEQPISKNLKLGVFDSYDHLNGNIVGFALTATLGQDSMVYSNNILDRLVDPVERHVGIINTGAGIYDQKTFKPVGFNLQYNNVYFIAPSSINRVGIAPQASESLETTDFGTYGHPAPLNQRTLNKIEELSPRGSRIYIQGGKGAKYYVDSSTAQQSDTPNGDYGLVVYSNQNLLGRSTDYTAPAGQNERPQILVDGKSINNYNGFIISGTETTLSDLVITTEFGYINGTIPSTSTGIVVYNESETDKTLNIINTSVSNLADGLYAQNDSSIGSLTINLSHSNFDYNGGDQGLDNISIGGYNHYGAAGLIAINNNGISNGLIINTRDTSFNYNGVMSGEASGINNNNFSIAAGLLVINNSDTGSVIVNANHSTFNNNGALNGNSNFIVALERGDNGNSIDTAAATGLYVRNNTTQTGTMTINAIASTFNNNGTLGGSDAIIIAGGTGAGANVNNAVAAGVYIFNNSSGNASDLITLNATNSSFNFNGLLNGAQSIISTYADNDSLGRSDNSAIAAGVFSFNNSTNLGSLTINSIGSTFNNNGMLSGAESIIGAISTNPNFINESVIASASGIFGFNANNQGNNQGLLLINVDYSSFTNNGTLSGNAAFIQSLNFNSFGSGSAEMASAAGISGFTVAGGDLVINAPHSVFNLNGTFAGLNNDIVAAGGDVGVYGSSGLFILNNSGSNGDLLVTNLTGSNFDENGLGTIGYGIYAYKPDITGLAVVNDSGAIFGGPPQTDTNQGISDGNVEWIN